MRVMLMRENMAASHFLRAAMWSHWSHAAQAGRLGYTARLVRVFFVEVYDMTMYRIRDAEGGYWWLPGRLGGRWRRYDSDWRKPNS